jgi:hypothetical protein
MTTRIKHTPANDMTDLNRRFDDACVAFAKGVHGFRATLREIKEALGVDAAQGLTEAQRTALHEYRTRLYLTALAVQLSDRPGAHKPTQAEMVEAELIWAKKGYNILAPDKDERRTKEQEQILTNMRQAWSSACKALAIPAIDNRGGQPIRDPQAGTFAGQVREALTTAPNAHILKVMPPPRIDYREFMTEMATLMNRYLQEHEDHDNPYAKLLEKFVREASKIEKASIAA